MSLGRYAIPLALLSLPHLAIAAPSGFTLNGDDYVKLLARPEPLSAYDYMQREKAYSYLDGARDATAGSVWCDRYTRKTPDLAYEMSDAIAKLPTSERAKNAATLIQAILHKAYPCTKGVKP